MLKKLGAAARSVAARFLDWWKKKVPVSGGGESHTLTFEGARGSAQLVLKSLPQKPSEFLAGAAAERKVPEKDRPAPIATAQTQEAAIAVTQAGARRVRRSRQADARRPAEKAANALAGKLDDQLGILGAHIGGTLNVWGVIDKPVGKISVPRKSFTYEMKKAIADAHPDKDDIAKDSKGRPVNLSRRRSWRDGTSCRPTTCPCTTRRRWPARR